MQNVIIHPTSRVHPTACINDNVEIGPDCVIKEFVTLKGKNKIGRHVWVYQHASVAYGTIIEDDVYIGIGVIITNTRSVIHGRQGMKQRAWETGGITIRRGARIGAGAIILPGLEIGEEAEIGAGAVVTESCKPYSTYVGVPAKFLREVPEEEWLKPRWE